MLVARNTGEEPKRRQQEQMSWELKHGARDLSQMAYRTGFRGLVYRNRVQCQEVWLEGRAGIWQQEYWT